MDILKISARRELDEWMRSLGVKIVEQEYRQCFTGEFWAHGDRLRPVRQVSANQRHHLGCILIQKIS